MKKIISTSIVILLTACGSGSNNTDTINQNQALLGPLSGATVTAYLATDLNTAVETTTTTTGNDLNNTGRFTLTLSGLADSDWVLVKVSGGEDIDANDDGVIDTIPTDNLGSVYSLATAGSWRSGANVTPLTDMIYHFADSHYNSLSTPINNGTMMTFLNNYANQLTQDINNDGQVNYSDVMQFKPYNHKNHYKHDWQSLRLGAITNILRGNGVAERDEYYNAIKLSIDNPQNTMQSTQTNGDSIAVTTITNDNDPSEKAVIVRQQQSSATISTYLTASNNTSPTGTTHIHTKDGRLSISFPLDNADTLNQAAMLTEQSNAISVSTTVNSTGTYYTVNIPKAYFSSWAASSPTISINGIELKASDFIVVDDDPIIAIIIGTLVALAGVDTYADYDNNVSVSNDIHDLRNMSATDSRCLHFDTNQNQCIVFDLPNSLVYSYTFDVGTNIDTNRSIIGNLLEVNTRYTQATTGAKVFAAKVLTPVVTIAAIKALAVDYVTSYVLRRTVGEVNIFDKLDTVNLGEDHYPALWIHNPVNGLKTEFQRKFYLFKKCSNSYSVSKYRNLLSIELDRIKTKRNRSYLVFSKTAINIANVVDNANSDFVLHESYTGVHNTTPNTNSDCVNNNVVRLVTYANRADYFTTGNLRDLEDFNNGNNSLTAPTVVIATASSTQVNLEWNAVNGISEYAVYYSTNQLIEGVPLNSIQRQTSSNTNTNITGLTNGTPYYFAIASIDGGNESMLSHQVLAIPDAVGNNFGSANQLTIGQTVNASINTASDEDYYQFTPNSNGVITIQTQGNLDTYGTLYDSNNNELITNDDGDYDDSGRNFKITHSVSSGKTYYIKVTSYNGRIGDYSLNIMDITFQDPEDTYIFGAWTPTTAVITEEYINQTRSCEIEINGEIDSPALNCDTQATTRTIPNPTFQDPENALASYANLHVISHNLNEYGDHNIECSTQLGSTARLADWNDIVSFYNNGGSLDDFKTQLRIADWGSGLVGNELSGSYRISRNGNEIWSGNRHYLVSRHDHSKPGNYLAHANIDNHNLSLGSWYGNGGYALCYQ